VSDACNGCNQCAADCPTGAIGKNGVETVRSECIVCLSCLRNCPEKAVSFGFRSKDPNVDLAGVAIGRRGFIGGALGGVVAVLGTRADSYHPSRSFIPLPFRSQDLIRPPGALPEPRFLERCARCGECIRACPTNTLQPDWYRAGLEGLWAPRMDLRHGACDQKCNVCGQVCPTESIRPLSLTERRHARVGTAILLRDRCLPWARDDECLICETQCPYAAIHFQQDEVHHVGLPVVDALRCNGCGKCEDMCPLTGDSAIVITPDGELRLPEGSYVEECLSQGLVFEEKDQGRDEFQWIDVPR